MKRWLKRILLGIAAVFIVIVAIVLFNTFRSGSRQIELKSEDLIEPIPLPNGAIERLAHTIRIPTISFEDRSLMDSSAFMALHHALDSMYPLVDSILAKTLINNYSLLYEWKGSDPELKPILLLGHQDVVPVESGTEMQWRAPAFSGQVDSGYLYGRGSLDDKFCITGILEAVELLLKEGKQPKRTILMAFGHDEEVGGEHGAEMIASYIKEQGIEIEFVLDEGLVVTDGIFPGLEQPLALIGLAEKGNMSITLEIELDGGHSSMPEKQTAIGALSDALAKIESCPFPAKLDGPVLQMFKTVGPELPFANRMAIANLWLFEGVLKSKLAAAPSTDASIRTTQAITIIDGGTKANVLPSKARATINFRTLPGDNIEYVAERIREIIDDDRIKLTIMPGAKEPTRVASTSSEGFQNIELTIRQVFEKDNVLVSPALVLAGTDARHYEEVAENVYRFVPLFLNSEDLKRIHGTNERISIENYTQVIAFFHQLMLNTAF